MPPRKKTDEILELLKQDFVNEAAKYDSSSLQLMGIRGTRVTGELLRAVSHSQSVTGGVPFMDPSHKETHTVMCVGIDSARGTASLEAFRCLARRAGAWALMQGVLENITSQSTYVVWIWLLRFFHPDQPCTTICGKDVWLRNPWTTSIELLRRLSEEKRRNKGSQESQKLHRAMEHVKRWLELPSRKRGPTKKQKTFIQLIVNNGGRIAHADLSVEGDFLWEDPRDGAKKMVDRIKKRIKTQQWDILPQDRETDVVIILREPRREGRSRAATGRNRRPKRTRRTKR